MPKNSPRFMLSGGGTGGHIFPAISIADALRERYPDAPIHFVGARDRMEMERIPKAGYSITGLWISGLNRSSPLKNLGFPFKVLSSLLKAHRLLWKHRPQVVIGTGGFASGPLLYAANQQGIPTLIQEQNSYPGVTNKWLAAKANRICVAYEGLERFFPSEKLRLTGNPIRQDLLKPLSDRKEALNSFKLPDAPTLLVLGGSLGAKRVNEAIEREFAHWLDLGYNLIWQTGRLYNEALKERIPSQKGLWMDAFIQDMRSAMSAADLVVSRAGAGTLSELEVLGKAALLIPSPNVAEDHQTHNAMALVQKGAAELLKEEELNSRLRTEVDALLGDGQRRSQLQENISKLRRPNATQDIVDAIIDLIPDDEG